jgi:hypothetical protein
MSETHTLDPDDELDTLYETAVNTLDRLQLLTHTTIEALAGLGVHEAIPFDQSQLLLLLEMQKEWLDALEDVEARRLQIANARYMREHPEIFGTQAAMEQVQ